MKPILLFLLLDLLVMHGYGQDTLLRKPTRDTLHKRQDTGLTKIDSLQAAIVTAEMRLKLKGDTLEYNTENIHMQPNAVVEELLRRLPGLEIDANGNITYNGEKIQRLLVDGEDIFGDNPTLIMQNFDASKIARVQIVERKSDQAAFTGIDDGSRTKTLNLVMKENAKDGYFGKAEAGANTNGYYDGNGVLAEFKGKEQVTALGLASNTGVSAFSSSTGGSSSSLAVLNGPPDVLGASAGTGIPQFAGIALHYANTWDNPEDHLWANYQYGNLNTRPVTTTQTQQAQPGNFYDQSQQSRSVNGLYQHGLSGTYSWKMGSASDINVIFHGVSSLAQNQLNAVGTSFVNDTTVNGDVRSIQDAISRYDIGANATWKIRTDKRGRQFLSFGAGLNKSDISTNGYVYSINNYYNTAVQPSDTVDQRKQIGNPTTSVNGSIGYTLPLWMNATVGLSYGLSVADNEPLQYNYDRGDGKYQEKIDSLSTDFKTRTVNQQALISLEGKSHRLNYTIGTAWLGYNYRQHDLLADAVVRLQHFNLAPIGRLVFTPNSTTNFSLAYTSQTQLPSILQLTPATNNSDPLHISIGNPNIHPTFDQDIRLEFHRSRTWLVNLSLDLQLTNNAISTETVTDSLGRQITQPVNVNGQRTLGFNFYTHRKVAGVDLGIFTRALYMRTLNYVNTDLSANDAYIEGGGISVNKYVDKKFSLQLNTGITHFNQVSSINSSAPIQYWSQSHRGSLTFFFIPNVEINTNAVYTWQEKTSAFTGNTSVLLWNAYIGRNFAHDKLVVRFQFNNMLNANSGITRTFSANVNTENSTNILGRYWMVTATWHFDKKFKQK